MHECAHAERVSVGRAERFGPLHRSQRLRMRRLLGTTCITRLQHVGLGETGVRATEIRIAGNRLLIQIDRLRQIRGTALPHPVVRAQEQHVGLDVRRRRRREPRARRQRVDQTSGNGGGKLVLHLENVRHAAVVSLRPLLQSRVCIDQLCGDAQTIAVAFDAALQHRPRVELSPDATEVLAALAKAEARRLRDHPYAVNAAQRVHDLFGQPVAEELVVRTSRRTYEGEHGDVHAIERFRRCRTRVKQDQRRCRHDRRQCSQQPAARRLAVPEILARKAHRGP